jgi:hypothetical protein
LINISNKMWHPVRVVCLVVHPHLSFESSMNCSKAPLMLKVCQKLSLDLFLIQMSPLHKPEW